MTINSSFENRTLKYHILVCVCARALVCVRVHMRMCKLTFLPVYIFHWNQLPAMEFYKSWYECQAFQPTPLAHILFSSVKPIL